MSILIEGTIENIIYENAENGYAVCEIASGNQLIVLTGYMPGMIDGETIVAHGEWTTHAEYGDQFKVEYFERVLPSTEAEIEKYLASGILPGIGKTTAKRIVEKFGAESLNIIENEHERLTEIKGLTAAKVDIMYKKYIEQIGVREVVMYFQKYNISAACAVKTYRVFGIDAISQIEKNPYILADEIDGISFKMADTIAAKIGFDRNSKERIASGIKFMMNSVAYLNGHTFMPRSAMITQAAGFLEVEVSNVEEVVSKLLLEKELVIENMGEYDGIYLKLFYDAEKTVAERLISMSQIVFDVDSNDINARIADIEEETDIKLADMQIEAVQTVFENSALVITGGPGTGKTTIINTIIKIMEKMHKRVALAAPTGRAAKRMTEVCGVEAKTIHRLLEIEPGADEIGRQFARNAENTLECDILIVDEMSMVDILLMSSLLLAMPKNAKIIMVGDSDQLPSVGAGNVLKDIIESGTVSCIQLTEIFRQAKESMIVVNAHRINHGEMPLLNDQDNDFF
ncbi:MAG: AAA family ATPase, partial [Oscillospiraceae bacterium]